MTQEFWNGSIGGEKHSHPRLISRVVERPKLQPADRWPTECEDAKLMTLNTIGAQVYLVTARRAVALTSDGIARGNAYDAAAYAAHLRIPGYEWRDFHGEVTLSQD